MKGETNTPEASFGYVRGLDGLRLLAVGIVIVRHYEIVMQLPGGFGVSIFFLISGFLIARLLLAEEKARGRIALVPFYLRRFVRLLPPLVLMGVIAVPALVLVDPGDASPAQIGLSFAYLGNLVKFGAILFGWGEGYPALEPLWSLAVEEHFYLMLAPLLLFVRSRRARVWAVGAAIVVPLALRILVYSTLDADLADELNYHFTFTRIDSMAFGVLLTLLMDGGIIRVPKNPVVGRVLFFGGTFLMAASMVHWTPIYEIAIKYTPQSLAIGCFFFGLMFCPVNSFFLDLLEKKPVVHLGRISYEMYLWHFPILAVVGHFVPTRLVAIMISLVLTVAISDAAYRVTTKRLRGLRRRLGGHPVEATETEAEVAETLPESPESPESPGLPSMAGEA